MLNTFINPINRFVYIRNLVLIYAVVGILHFLVYKFDFISDKNIVNTALQIVSFILISFQDIRRIHILKMSQLIYFLSLIPILNYIVSFYLILKEDNSSKKTINPNEEEASF